MKGFPKFFNTKEDVLHALDLFPEQTRTYLQELIDTRYQWLIESKLSLDDLGVTDDTHKVVENKNQETEEITERYQYVLAEDPNCFLFRLGFSVAEAETIVKTAE